MASSGSYRAPTFREPERHLPNRILRSTKCLTAAGFNPKESLGTPAALSGRLAQGRTDIALRFETVESGIHRSNREVPAGAFLNLATNRHAICIGFQAHQREQHDVLKGAQEVSAWHLFYTLEQKGHPRQTSTRSCGTDLFQLTVNDRPQAS